MNGKFRLISSMIVGILLIGLLTTVQRVRSQTTENPLYLPVVRVEAIPYPPAATPIPPTPTPIPPSGNAWLDYFNMYRAMANLPAVGENTDWSNGDWLHARYTVKEDTLAHSEDPSSPWYTAEGNTAAGNSNVMASSSSTASDAYAIDLWMTGPFHAVGMLDPALATIGFGSYREADGGYQMGAALDVLRGLGSIPDGTQFPIIWPKDGATVGLRSHCCEGPSPLTSCPGYSEPSGLPVIVQIGPGNLVPDVTAHSFSVGGTQLDHCVFDETNYLNPNSGNQSLGRSVLNSRDAIVLIPKEPLVNGSTYTASISANGITYTWSFTVDTSVRLSNGNLSGVEFDLGGLQLDK